MTIIVILLFIFIVATSRITKYNEEYLDKKYTNIIKGIFLSFVFISHFISYKPIFQNGFIDNLGINFIKGFGQLMVTSFLFYSGYGVMESIKKNGEEYIKKFPKKRILTTLLNFDFAVLIYMLMNLHFNFYPFSIEKLLLALIGWDGFGNSNWYIFTILIMYSITFISVKIFKNRKARVISIFFMTIIYTIIMSFFKEEYWYNTAFCYVLGLFISSYKDEIQKWLKGKELVLLFLFIVFFIISYSLIEYKVWYYICTIIFTIVILLLTRKIKINNLIFEWMGKNLFSIYIFQRIPMMLLIQIDFMKNNTYLYFVLCMIITFVLAFVYNKTIMLKNRLVNSNNV